MKSTEKNAANGAGRHLHELVTEFRTAMLVTHDGKELRSRPMGIAEVLEKEIWFSTSRASSKTDEIEKNPRALVTMQDATRFVSLGGTCVLSQDRAKIEKLWNESWKIWFPKGKQDPDIVLIGVRIENGEFWDNSGQKGLRFLWEAAKAYFSGERAETVPEAHGTV